jgi:ribosomal protein RSM22 (predicted rRNA methylase)
MIYYKNLQTNQIIEFVNENAIGNFFYNESLFKKLTKKEITGYEFNKIKEQKIQQVNSIASQKITLNYPIYKQINISCDYDKESPQYIEMRNYINTIRGKSNEIETLINNCATKEELELIDVESLFN